MDYGVIKTHLEWQYVIYLFIEIAVASINILKHFVWIKLTINKGIISEVKNQRLIFSPKDTITLENEGDYK